MAIDAVIGGVADLFASGAADAGIGAIGADIGADLGLTAADAGLGAADIGAVGAADAIGGGAADLGLTAADLGAGAGEAGAAAGGDLAATDLGGVVAGAGDFGGAGADVGAAAPDFALPAAETSALEEGLGGGGSLGDALDTAPSLAATPADTATSSLGGLAQGNQAALESAGNTAAGTGGVAGPTTAIQNADTNIAAQLGADTSTITTPDGTIAGPTTQQAVGSQSVAGDVANEAAGGATGPSSDLQAAQLAGGGNANTGAASAGGVASTINDAGASGGLSSTLNSALSSPYTKAAELALPLGFLGYQAYKGPPSIPPQANQAVANAEANIGPLESQASQNVPLFNQTAALDLNEANNFQISPAQAAALNIQKQNSINTLYQQLVDEGNADPKNSTAWVEGMNQINQQYLAGQTSMVQQLITTAFQSASAANAAVSTEGNLTAQLDATLMQAAQLQVSQDNAYQQSLVQALQAFGLFAGLSSVKGGSGVATP